MLEGKKTYIMAGLLVLNNVAQQMGWMTPETTEILNWIFGGGALAALRMGVAKK